MMGGLSAKKAPNPLQQHSGLNQYNRSQGPMHNRPVYNSNQVPRQANIGMRNNLPHQPFMRGGGNNYHQRFANHQGNYNRFNNSSGSANSFDDKNRDTFGEDFVMDQNNRRGNSLITPAMFMFLESCEAQEKTVLN